jgi:hypothetical protein
VEIKAELVAGGEPKDKGDPLAYTAAKNGMEKYLKAKTHYLKAKNSLEREGRAHTHASPVEGWSRAGAGLLLA